MISRGASSIAILALGAAACGAGEARLEPKRPKDALVVQSIELDDGLRVELAAGPCGDRVGLAVLVEVGADHDPPGRSGMAEVVARLWSSSDEERVAVGRDHTIRAWAVSADALPAALDDAAAAMGRLEVTEEALARARSEVRADVEARRGGDATRTARTLAAEAVRPSAGGGRRGGVAEEVEAIDAGEVAAHTEAHFTPRNARLIVTGDFDPFAVRSLVEEAFAEVPAGTPAARRDPATSRVTGTLVMGDAPSAVAWAVPAPDPSDGAYPAFLLLAARLMGAESDAWEVEYEPVTRPELLYVTGAVAPTEPAEPAAARMRAEVQAIVERPVAADEVGEARRTFATFLGRDVTDPEACAGDPRRLAIGRARRAQLDLDAREVSLDEALEATSDTERARAAALFDPSSSAAVIAGGAIR